MSANREREPSSKGLRVAVVVEDGRPDGEPDDRTLYGALERAGGIGTPVPWGRALDPERFDVALVRTPWEYFRAPERFFAWADACTVPLFNPAHVLRWNGHKRYLVELQAAGVARLPATVLVGPDARSERAEPLARALDADRVVLKPAVSGGAFRTRVVDADDAIDWSAEDVGDFVAQAFVPAVCEEGEWSVTVFGGEVSHAVLKRPREGDFRVQEEHGGAVEVFPDVPDELARAAQDVLEGARGLLGLAEPLVQARVDLVRDPSGGPPLLMELELIEPELFLRAREGSADALVAALYRASRS
ncbi:MAG: hypothetical protein AAFU73_02485 [Planctomycetota bacterium]